MRLDYIKYALKNVIHRKMRSWLTVLSILIGIAAIYALVSFGQGLSSYVDSLSSQIGKDKLIVQAKGMGVPGIDETFYIPEKDVDFLRKLNGVREAVGIYIKIAEVKHKKQKKYVFAASITQGDGKEMVKEAFTLELGRGRLLKRGDKLKTVLGYNYQLPDRIFKKALNLRDKIDINGRKVEIVGFYESVGNPQDDSNVYFTDEGVELIFPETTEKYQMAIARVDPGVDAGVLAETATEKMRKFKGQKKGQEDFFIQTYEQAIAIFTNIMAVINGVLVLIALVSLVVAGVNIMNTMYTAVLERTREIGVMKAVGARNSDVMSIFLIESGVLGLVGGVLGVFLGYGIAKLGGGIAAQAGYSMLQPVFPLALTIGCLLFAFFIGAGSGFLPALQAAKLKPVDSLRYE